MSPAEALKIPDFAASVDFQASMKRHRLEHVPLEVSVDPGDSVDVEVRGVGPAGVLLSWV